MRAALVCAVIGLSCGLHLVRPAARPSSSRRHAAAVEPSPVESAVRSLADVTLSLLAGDVCAWQSHIIAGASGVGRRAARVFPMRNDTVGPVSYTHLTLPTKA